MNIWVVRDLEPIPGDPGDRRLLRTHMLCRALVARGHSVTWYTSSFDHYFKRQRASRDDRIEVGPGFAIEVLACRGYASNVSLSRILHNRQFARRFRQRFLAAPDRPDMLVTDIPTTETAATVVALGRSGGIPTVLSVRDTWPDSFPDLLPRPVRPLAAPFISVLARQARFALRHATALVGISDQYLDWALARAGRSQGPLDAIVPLGYLPVELSASDAAELRANLGLAEPLFTVAFTGSWGHSADLSLVAAVAEACLSRPDIRFVIGGNPEGNPAMAARLRKLPNVRLLGWLGDRQIAAVLGEAGLGLLPYRTHAPQGLPNKAFEYFAYGTFQLSSLGGELQRFYRKTGAGEVVEPPTASAFTETILAHADGWRARPDRERLRTAFAEHYAAHHVYAGFAGHIETVARSSLPSRAVGATVEAP